MLSKKNLLLFLFQRAKLISSQRFNSQFIPKHDPVQEQDIRNLENFLSDKTQVLVLTGAGVSTESGAFWKSHYK